MPQLTRSLVAALFVASTWSGGPRVATAAPAVANGVVGSGSPASCTYAELAEEVAAGGNITFACGAAPHTIVMQAANGLQPPVGSTSLDGGGLITLSGGNVADRRIFYVTVSSVLTLTHLTLSDATMANFAGGALRNQGRLVLDDVTIHHATAQDSWGGGAIYNQGVLFVRNSRLFENASAGGGALFNEAGAHATLENTRLFSNTVPNGLFGGAIFNSGRLTVTASAFTSNHLTLEVACPAPYPFCGGGALANLSDGVTTVTGSTFEANTTDQAGGGIYNLGSLAVSNSYLFNNSSPTFGGGLTNLVTATAVLTNVVLQGNAAQNGGAVYNYNHAYISLTDATLQGNEAVYGAGGLLNDLYSGADLTNVTLSANQTGNGGGAIENMRGSNLFLTHSTLSGNQSATGPGGLYNYQASAILTYVTINANASTEGSDMGGISNATSYSTTHLWLYGVLLANNYPRNCNNSAPDLAEKNLSTDAYCFMAAGGNLLSAAQSLGPLANNGGLTRTHLPAPGSPALNVGPCLGGYNFDQRGLPRPASAGCDIGAVERQANDAGWYIFLPTQVR